MSLAPFTASATESGCQGELALAHATEPVLGLRSGSLVLQGDTRAHNRAQRIVKERVQVANANFLASQRAVGTTGFTNSATTTQMAIGCAAQPSTSTNSITSLADGLAAILRKTLRLRAMKAQALLSSSQKNTTHKTPNPSTGALISLLPYRNSTDPKPTCKNRYPLPIEAAPFHKNNALRKAGISRRAGRNYAIRHRNALREKSIRQHPPYEEHLIPSWQSKHRRTHGNRTDASPNAPGKPPST